MPAKLAERLVITVQLDPFMSLRALSSYGGLSVRKLREYLDHPVHPIPSYRVGGKVLVRRSDFDAWISRFRRSGRVNQIVDDILESL